MEKEKEETTKITISYDFKNYEKLMNVFKNKGIGTGILFCALLTLVWSQIGSYADCISCYYNVLAGLYFIVGLGYKIYAHRLEKQVKPERVEEETDE